MDTGKTRENFDKDGKLKCFNCNIYRYMVKKCRKIMKEWDTRKYYKCDKVGYIVKDCKLEQKIKNCSIQEETDDKKNKKQESFGKGPEQEQYDGPLYLMFRIDILFQIKGMVKKESLT